MKQISACDKSCVRCGKQKVILTEFCNGSYLFCDECTKDWLELLNASNHGGWNGELFEWWLKHSPFIPFNPSKRNKI